MCALAVGPSFLSARASLLFCNFVYFSFFSVHDGGVRRAYGYENGLCCYVGANGSDFHLQLLGRRGRGYDVHPNVNGCGHAQYCCAHVNENGFP